MYSVASEIRANCKAIFPAPCRLEWDAEKTPSVNYHRNHFLCDANGGFGRNRKLAPLEVPTAPPTRFSLVLVDALMHLVMLDLQEKERQVQDIDPAIFEDQYDDGMRFFESYAKDARLPASSSAAGLRMTLVLFVYSDLRAIEGKQRKGGRAAVPKLTAHQQQIVERLMQAHGNDIEVACQFARCRAMVIYVISTFEIHFLRLWFALHFQHDAPSM